MSTNTSIDPAIKAEVMSKIRDHGMKVSDVAPDYNISTKTVYRWLRDGVVNSIASLVLQINRLKKENEQLYKLLGRAMSQRKLEEQLEQEVIRQLDKIYKVQRADRTLSDYIPVDTKEVVL